MELSTLLTIALLLIIGLGLFGSFFAYRSGRQRGAVEKLPGVLTKEEIEKAVNDLRDLKAHLEGQHTAVVSEKDRMLASAQSVTQTYAKWTEEYAQRVRKIDDSLGSISKSAVDEVKNMAGVIQPVIAMFKTPQIAGIQYAEAELELLLKVHLGEGSYERKPSHLAVGGECVDFVVKLPDCAIPIDSKFPEAVYRAWADAKDETEAKPRWRVFRDALLKQMEATEKYIRPEAGTTDYALLFLPSDVIWQQAFLVRQWYGDDNPILRRSQELRVFGCSAQTLMPYFGLLRLGLGNLKVANDVKAVRQQIDQLGTSFARLVQDWGIIRKHIGHAQSAVSEAEGPKGSFASVQRDVDRLTEHKSGMAGRANVTVETNGGSG